MHARDEGLAHPVRLRAEQLPVGDLLGLGTARPRLSWVVPAAPSDWAQSGYEVQVRRGLPGTEPATTTVQVAGAEQVLVPWPFEPLRSRERAQIEVRVRGQRGWSGWSGTMALEAGLLVAADWQAHLVAPPWAEEPAVVHETAGTDRADDVASRVSGRSRLPLLRREFTVPGPVAQARLYVTAHGLVEPELNGERVGDEALTPGWSVYPRRQRYATFDVTALVGTGANVLGAWLGDGWWRGRLGFDGGVAQVYGDRLGLVAQLEVVGVDGTLTVVTSDDAWRATPGPVLGSGLYEGETHDARLLPTGWSACGFDDSTWQPVRTEPFDAHTLEAPTGPPVRCTRELTPVSQLRLPDGTIQLDFGQNMAGRLRISLDGAAAGTRLVLRHAEVLADGRLCTRPLRTAVSEDVYVCRGGQERWEPRFTLHGFRYAEITGWPAEPAHGEVVARVHHTDTEPSGWFTCSDPLVEQLHRNIVWSMRSNFVDLPTDCPQRDERLGWTGDIAAFAPTAAFLTDCTGMLSGWLADLAVEQERFGTVPPYVPFVPLGFFATPVPFALWGDAAVLVPWALYESTADRELLVRQYASARAWVDQVLGLLSPDGTWDTGIQLGDWLDPAAPPDNPTAARTSAYLVATAFAAHSLRLVSRWATTLGHDDDAARYGNESERVRVAFRARWLRPDGRMSDDAQTAYALAIALDLLDAPAERAAAGARLAELVDEAEGLIATGFAGTPFVAPALTATGHVEQAYRLLQARRCPSWLYQVLMGATTTWERWDSMLLDGTVNPGDMTSFNHYALGAVADWLHRSVAGLAPAEPGYRRVRVAPHPGGGLTHAAARHLGPYGEVAVSWRLENDGRLEVEVDVPVGSTAEIDLPGHDLVDVGHGHHTFQAVLAEK